VICILSVAIILRVRICIPQILTKFYHTKKETLKSQHNSTPFFVFFSPSMLTNNSKSSNLLSLLKLNDLKVFKSQADMQSFDLVVHEKLFAMIQVSIPLKLDSLRNNPHNYIWNWMAPSYFCFRSAILN